MVMTYRRPGVYLEESLLVNPSDVGSATTVASFVGAAIKGPINEPQLVESWNDYVSLFGGFSLIIPPDGSEFEGKQVLTYMPYSVYSYFQNGGRYAYIIRSASSTDKGEVATITVNGKDTTVNPLTSFDISALSVGTWGNSLKYGITVPPNDPGTVFTLQVYQVNSNGIDEIVETFPGLSVTGAEPGSRRVDSVVNDPYAGSRYISISGVLPAQPKPEPTATPRSLAGGTDPDLPDVAALSSSADAITKVEGPILINVCGYLEDASAENSATWADSYVSTTLNPSGFTDRQDIMVINDSAPPRLPGQTSGNYATAINTSLGQYADSYIAAYGPWIIIPNPQRVGTTITIPPGGAVMGMMGRIDATIGVFRAPAGVIAGLSNAVGVQTKFTDTELGDLNQKNINVVRSVVGAGICVMGARTRKSYGADKYVSARRTLIYIKETLRRSTQWAVFENNDQRLWSGLRQTADRLLRPMWEAGGLRGTTTADAYYITCDETINTPNVIQSGEVRMEVGVALEYPAEFVVIRITQFDRGTFSSEVTPQS